MQGVNRAKIVVWAGAEVSRKRTFPCDDFDFAFPEDGAQLCIHDQLVPLSQDHNRPAPPLAIIHHCGIVPNRNSWQIRH